MPLRQNEKTEIMESRDHVPAAACPHRGDGVSRGGIAQEQEQEGGKAAVDDVAHRPPDGPCCRVPRAELTAHFRRPSISAGMSFLESDNYTREVRLSRTDWYGRETA